MMGQKLFWTWILVSIFSLHACKDFKVFSTEGTQTMADAHTFLNSEKGLISAHRAGKGLRNYPENALETIQHLHAKGIVVFEIDIIGTADDELMLFHDDHLERLTNGTGKIQGLSSAQLQEYLLVDDFDNYTKIKIPFLRDVLDWGFKNNVYYMIDFKRSANYEKTIALIRDYGMENQCILISYNNAQATKLHKLAPEMLISVSARNLSELDRILSTGIPQEKMVAFTGTRLSEQSLYDRLNEMGIPVILGTLGNLDNMAAARGDHLYKEWRDRGVHIFATDRPMDAFNALAQ